MTDMVLPGGEGMVEFVGGNVPGFDADLDFRSVLGFGCRSPELGPLDAGGEFSEVVGEFGFVVEFKFFLMGGEKVENLGWVAQPPPMTMVSVAKKIPFAHQAQDFFVPGVLGGGQDEAQVFGRAFDFDGGAFVFGFLEKGVGIVFGFVPDFANGSGTFGLG